MSHVKHDYRREPMVLLAWGLGPDFNAGRGVAAGWRGRMASLLTTFAIASIVLLAAV